MLRMLLYYITDRHSLKGTEAQQRASLLRCIAAAAGADVDYIQLREKDLVPKELEQLARETLHAVRENSVTTKLIINGRADIALAVGADGVHLAAHELAASEVRTLWMHCSTRPPALGVSAHSLTEVRYAEAHGADFAVLAPIFEKATTKARAIGLDALRAACGREAGLERTEAAPRNCFPVLALGGVTVVNARKCLEAGAAGVAGIRLFQKQDLQKTVRQLRKL